MVSGQNGLNELAIASIAGAERTVGAFVNFGADYMEPGVVHYGGRGVLPQRPHPFTNDPRHTTELGARLFAERGPRAVVPPKIDEGAEPTLARLGPIPPGEIEPNCHRGRYEGGGE